MTDDAVPVLIVGAGPVGLVAAIDLAWRGVACTVVETRRTAEAPVVKCNHVSARTMEAFRRLGFAATVRESGLPPDYPNDVAFFTTVLGTELARIPIPSVERRRRGDVSGYPDGDWPTPEPPHRINQLYLEPILFEHAARQERITLLNRTRFEEFEEVDDTVVATLRNLETGRTHQLAARYLIGCDGARSQVRRGIGARFEGNPEIARNLSSHIRAPELIRLMRARREPSWMSHAINPRRSGNVIAIDGEEQWLVHCRVKDDEPDFAAIDREEAIRTVLGVGPDFHFEILGTEDWVARRLVADRMRRGRVFICGDAAHIWIPVAGYGMNCGIADALNLTWKLDAVEAGWAAPAILDSFESERHPITEQVSHFVADLGISLTPRRNRPPPGLEDAGPEGDAARQAFGREMYAMNVAQYNCAGLNFGYFYADSPIVAGDGEAPPAYDMASYVPSTVPGCRLPHLWLPDGRSLYDLLGPVYTLLRFRADADPEPLLAAARRAGLPLAYADLGGAGGGAYRHSLVIARPDQHVAWRGDAAPQRPEDLMARLAGHAAVPLAAAS